MTKIERLQYFATCKPSHLLIDHSGNAHRRVVDVESTADKEIDDDPDENAADLTDDDPA